MSASFDTIAWYDICQVVRPTHPYIVSRDDDMVLVVVSSLLLLYFLYIYIYMCVLLLDAQTIQWCSKEVFFSLFFSLPCFFFLIEIKKLWESAFSLSMYIDNPFSHTYYRIKNLSSALKKTTIILIFYSNNNLFLTSIMLLLNRKLMSLTIII